MRASISLSRLVVQFVLALCLISAIVIAGFALSAPTRGATAIASSVSSADVAVISVSKEVASLVHPMPFCGSSNGAC